MTTTTHHRPLTSLQVFMVASILIHALLLCIPFTAPVDHKAAKHERNLFAVQLLMPKAENKKPPLRETPKAPPAMPVVTAPTQAPLKKNPQPDEPKISEPQLPHPREATISLDRLNEDDKQYRTYIGHLRSKIGTVWNAPSAAREKGLNGVVTVRFTIASNGHLEALAIKKESSHKLLDSEALRIIRQAAPFMPFPAELPLEKLHVLTSFVYEFNAH